MRGVLPYKTNYARCIRRSIRVTTKLTESPLIHMTFIYAVTHLYEPASPRRASVSFVCCCQRSP